MSSTAALLPIVDPDACTRCLGGQSLLARASSVLLAAGVDRLYEVDPARPVADVAAQIPPHDDVVLVHDPLRALVPEETVGSVIAAVRAGAAAAVPAVAVLDTVKRVDGSGRIVSTVDRDGLRAVQSPCGFARRLLDRVGAESGAPAWNDLIWRLGEPVTVLPGHADGFAIRRAADVAIAERVLVTRRADPAGRSGR